MASDPENTLILDLKTGPVTIALKPDVAPEHVERIKELTRQGFYDGVVFHRVIPGFMAQTGDPTGTGAGGSELPNLKAEFSDNRTSAAPFRRRAPPIPTAPTASSSSASTTRPGWTGNIRCGAKWSRAWSMSTPSRKAASITTAPSPASRTRFSRRGLRPTHTSDRAWGQDYGNVFDIRSSCPCSLQGGDTYYQSHYAMAAAKCAADGRILSARLSYRVAVRFGDP